MASSTLPCFAIAFAVRMRAGSSYATAHLNEMNRIGGVPWQLSFSYGRALQAAPLKTWAGRAENREKAQRAFYHRARCNGAARTGSYTAEMERQAA